MASATLRGSPSRRLSSPLDSPMLLQQPGRCVPTVLCGRLRAAASLQQPHAQPLPPWRPQVAALCLSLPIPPPAPEVLHQLHRVPVVHLHLVHVDRGDGQARTRQQVAAVTHLRAVAPGQAQ